MALIPHDLLIGSIQSVYKVGITNKVYFARMYAVHVP